MSRDHHLTRIPFATGIIALGVLGLVYGDFALQWQPVAASVPFRRELAYLAAIVMVGGGVGLLFRRSTGVASRLLFPYLLLWVFLRVPAVVVAPQIEGTWLGLGEIVALMSGGWLLFASTTDAQSAPALRFATGANGRRIARILFGLALLPIGLSHLVYLQITVGLVPAWLPYRAGWAILTGVGQIAAGLGILFTVLPRVAVLAETGMLTLFALLVWLPAAIANPSARLDWTALCITWAVAGSSWVIARAVRADNPRPKHDHGFDMPRKLLQ